MRKEQRFEIRYSLTAATGEEVEKVLFVGSEAKELVNLAVEYRIEKCITAGHIDLLQHC